MHAMGSSTSPGPPKHVFDGDTSSGAGTVAMERWYYRLDHRSSVKVSAKKAADLKSRFLRVAHHILIIEILNHKISPLSQPNVQLLQLIVIGTHKLLVTHTLALVPVSKHDVL